MLSPVPHILHFRRAQGWKQQVGGTAHEILCAERIEELEIGDPGLGSTGNGTLNRK